MACLDSHSGVPPLYPFLKTLFAFGAFPQYPWGPQASRGHDAFYADYPGQAHRAPRGAHGNEEQGVSWYCLKASAEPPGAGRTRAVHAVEDV